MIRFVASAPEESAPDRLSIHAARTVAATTKPANGRYIRRSAPTSVEMGTTLDVGASVMKNHRPGKPTGGYRTKVRTVPVARTATTIIGVATSPKFSAFGAP